MQKAQEYENNHSIDEDVVRVLAATNNVKIEKTKREGFTMCTLFEEIARDSRVEGKMEGIIESKAEAILELLEDYGEIPEELKSKIMEQTDLEILRVWHKKAARANSIEEFAKTIVF